MIPAKYDLNIWTGFQLQETLRLKDGDGEFIDLTGATPYAEVRENRSAAVTLDLSPSVSDASNGEITIDVTDETTDALTVGTYAWDLMIDFGDGKRLGPYVVGVVAIKEGITQP